MPRRAAMLVIGNEILTGKVREGNLETLAQELFRMGITLVRAVVCPDDVDVIAGELNELRRTHDLVFTSGGVGPTHDDVTLPGIARAFDRTLERSPIIEDLIRQHWGDRVTDGHLRMADVPAGAEVVIEDVPWPVISIENVYVLPGVPEIFKLELLALRARIGSDTPFVTRAIYTMCDEGEIAALLETVTRDHPAVAIGSYPRWRDPAYRVKLTFDGATRELVDAALDQCRSGLPPGAIVRIE